MFFELTELSSIHKNTDHLSHHRSQLSHSIATAFSPEKVQSSLSQIIMEIFKQASDNLQAFHSIENDAESGLLIPSRLYIDSLLYNQEELPEWFDQVFQIQYAKQTKNFETIAKKLYKSHNLHQEKQKYERDIQAFQILLDRFQALSEKEAQVLDIMAEAEALKNKATLIKSKHLSFCELVVARLMDFLEENVKKSLLFSHQLNDFAQKAKTNLDSGLGTRKGFKEGEKEWEKTTSPTMGGYFRESARSRSMMRSMEGFSKRQTRPLENRYAPRWVNSVMADYYQ